MTTDQILTGAIDIGEQLLINGAEINRVEDTIDRICTAYHIRQRHIFCIASCIIVSLETTDDKWITQMRRIANYGTNMHKLDRLNNLSRTMCQNLLSWEEFHEEFTSIINEEEYSFRIQLAISSIAAAAFTIFFGGDLWDGFTSLFMGALLTLTLHGMQMLKIKKFFSNIICSVISGLACICACNLGLGHHLDTIMIGNIMLLIPGVLLTNSFRDLINGDTITGLLHFSEAMITAICVAGGFIIAIILTGGRL
ncbi:MAG: threonine/serine exporter family protein [Clostridium sp.]